MKEIYKVFDTEKIIKARIRFHKNKSVRPKIFPRTLNKIKIINGNQSVPKVTKDILKAIRSIRINLSARQDLAEIHLDEESPSPRVWKLNYLYTPREFSDSPNTTQIFDFRVKTFPPLIISYLALFKYVEIYA